MSDASEFSATKTPRELAAIEAKNRRRSRRLRTISVLPTLFTLGNLFCGFFAIVVAARVAKPVSDMLPDTTRIALTQGTTLRTIFDPTDPIHNCMLSGWLIFLAMIFDALDGHVARLAKSATNFGAQLDSLCDLVTFGVAPGFLMVKMVPVFTTSHPIEVWIMASIFPACAALRLARFNVETGGDDDHMSFRGLPSPAAAASIASFALLFYSIRLEPTTFNDWLYEKLQYILPFFSLTVAALMVSRIPYPHAINRLLRGKKSMGHLIGLLFALMIVGVFQSYAIPIISFLFVLGPPLKYLWKRWREPQPSNEGIF
jgi:CDP-diacylglycerol--serine O-phosphatidyltransferase